MRWVRTWKQDGTVMATGGGDLMLKEGIPLGRIFGIYIRLHYSWFFIFILITWSLAGSYFPTVYPEWSQATAVVIGLATSILFFASVLTHELAHSLITKSARKSTKNRKLPKSNSVWLLTGRQPVLFSVSSSWASGYSLGNPANP